VPYLNFSLVAGLCLKRICCCVTHLYVRSFIRQSWKKYIWAFRILSTSVRRNHS